MKKRIPTLLFLLGMTLIVIQISIYLGMSDQLELERRIAGDNSIKNHTVFHIELPEKWDYNSVLAFVGTLIGTYLFLIIGMGLLLLGVKLALNHKWKGFNRFYLKSTEYLTKHQGSPEQIIHLSDGAQIYIYREFDESSTRRFMKVTRNESGSTIDSLQSEDFQINDYYFFKSNASGLIQICAAMKFEGLFKDADQVEDWDDFLQPN